MLYFYENTHEFHPVNISINIFKLKNSLNIFIKLSQEDTRKIIIQNIKNYIKLK